MFNDLRTTFRALRSAGRIYSSRLVQKLIKDIKLRTYSVDELCWVEPDMKLIGVTAAEARPSAPLTQSRLLPAGICDNRTISFSFSRFENELSIHPIHQHHKMMMFRQKQNLSFQLV